MALRDAAIEGAGEAQCIVPTKAMAEVLKLLGDGAELAVGVRVDTNQIAFKTDTATLACRLIDGKYPRYERVIPTSWDRRITLDRDTFIQALKRMLVEKVITEKKSFTRVICKTELGALLLRTHGETGKAEDEVECELEGEAVEFGVNCEHLMDALDTLKGTQAHLEMTDATKPILIRGTDDAGECKLVVMPTQVL
jgi:DNA polymerase-3 subunit beta